MDGWLVRCFINCIGGIFQSYFVLSTRSYCYCCCYYRPGDGDGGAVTILMIIIIMLKCWFRCW